MKSIFLPVIATLLFIGSASAQVDKIEPPFWWTDMPVQELQIQLYGENLGEYRASLDYPGVEIGRAHV